MLLNKIDKLTIKTQEVEDGQKLQNKITQQNMKELRNEILKRPTYQTLSNLEEKLLN